MDRAAPRVHPRAERRVAHLGVQRLDATVHYLGRARVLGDIRHRQAGRAQRRRRAARRQQQHAARVQRSRYLGEARLVAHAQQRSLYGDLIHACTNNRSQNVRHRCSTQLYASVGVSGVRVS